MAPLSPDFVSDLAKAIVSSSNAPLLLLDGDQSILTASKSFCEAFDVEQTEVVGHQIFSLGHGEWDQPQLRSLLTGVASGSISIPSYQMDFHRMGHAPKLLVLNPQKLDYGDGENARIVLAITDITDERSNDKLQTALLAENAVLLREIQHRVANSLQIIASILMQSARRVQSDETRGHLQDAHSRVMSMAAVQKQLALSKDSVVEVSSYFDQLCKSLGASMINDPATLRILVKAEHGLLPADRAISLGLIITELVINALKHAFPDNKGLISISFMTDGEDWKLIVEDDGVGIVTAGPNKAKPGLGTSLIEALAQKLDAQIVIADAAPGTKVILIHKGVKGGSSAAQPSPRAV